LTNSQHQLNNQPIHPSQNSLAYCISPTNSLSLEKSNSQSPAVHPSLQNITNPNQYLQHAASLQNHHSTNQSHQNQHLTTNQTQLNQQVQQQQLLSVANGHPTQSTTPNTSNNSAYNVLQNNNANSNGTITPNGASVNANNLLSHHSILRAGTANYPYNLHHVNNVANNNLLQNAYSDYTNWPSLYMAYSASPKSDTSSNQQ